MGDDQAADEEVSGGFQPTFACCFCGLDITTFDACAINIAITNLIKPGTVQPLYAHAGCAENAITAAPFDAAAFTD